jgi:hypothetical protein
MRHMDSDAVYPLYVAVKYACYSLWCYYGLRLLRETRSAKSAAGFGFFRLLLGVVFGVGIFLIGGILHLNVPAHPVAMYLSIYAPVRYLEWSILAGLLLSGKNMARSFFDRTTQLWILGGIAVSHLADLPIIFFAYQGAKGFLPVGRFLC